MAVPSNAAATVKWPDFLDLIKSSGYTGKGDDLAEVKSWLSANGFDESEMDLGDNVVKVDELWKSRPGRRMDASVALERAKGKAELQAAVDERLKSLGLDKARTNGSTEDHSTAISVRDNVEDDPNLGYGKYDELGFATFLHDVRKSARLSRQGAVTQIEAQCPRLIKSQKIMVERLVKAGTGMNEAVDSEGGFLAMPEHSKELLRRTYETAVVMPRARQVMMTKPAFTIPYIVETLRTDGNRHGGVRAYRSAEGATLTASQPAFGRLTLTAKKLHCLGWVTDELEEDSDPGSLQLMGELFAEELGFTQDKEIIRGDGASQMLGIINAACLVSVSRTTSGSVDALDFINMWSRMYARSRTNAVWFINQDVEAVLPRMFIEDAASGEWGHLVYMPAGGISQSPHGTLFGRPIVPIEQATTLGTVGDVILADMTQYLHGSRRGPTAQQSVHIGFLSDQTAFKVTLRDDGQPWWQAALTPYQGTATQSPFVAIAT